MNDVVEVRERHPAATLALAVATAAAGFAFVALLVLNAGVAYPMLDAVSACSDSGDITSSA